MKEWLTIKEASIVVGRHVSRIYRWIENGRLRTHTGTDGIQMVSAEDVRRVESVTKNGRPRHADTKS